MPVSKTIVPAPASPATPVQSISPNVQYVRPELSDKIEDYTLISDCLKGQRQIKSKQDAYLPRPHASDTSDENKARYSAYIARAVFFGVTKATQFGLVGQIFSRDPVIEVPKLLDSVVKDADGSGVSLHQIAEKLANTVLAYGRAGVLADYPNVDAPTSRQQLLDGTIRPTITVYEPWSVINWRTKVRGGKTLLSLVVIAETYTEDDDGFEAREGKQFRVLRLVDVGGKDQYQVELWREPALPTAAVQAATGPHTYPVQPITGKASEGVPILHDQFTPQDAKGLPFDEIPFIFAGVTANDPSVDDPPLLDLANINVAHYRNSADYEESCFMVGQPTLVFSGITAEWYNTVLKGKAYIGSRGAISLNENATAELLQAEANGMIKEAMEAKERQMTALGAKLVEQKNIQRTAYETAVDQSAQSSTLSSIAKNASAAILWGLEWCGIFVGATTVQADAKATKENSSGDNAIKFELNSEFDLQQLSPEELKAVIGAWQANAISFTEMRESVRRSGLASLSDAEAQAEIDGEIQKSFANDPMLNPDINPALKQQLDNPPPPAK